MIFANVYQIAKKKNLIQNLYFQKTEKEKIVHSLLYEADMQ